MILRKLLVALVCSAGLLASHGALAAPTSALEVRANPVEMLTEYGEINSIDLARNRIVISDMEYGFSGATLVVHGGGRTSGLSSLRANQKIRFLSETRKPGSLNALSRTVTEIWIEGRSKP